MKRLYILLTLLVAAVSTMMAFVNYQSVVRENVRWVCKAYFQNPITEEVLATHYYAIEMRGDSIINGKTYKKCYSKILFGEPFYEKPYYVLDFESCATALIRDENHVVEVFYNGELAEGHFNLYDFSNREQSVKVYDYGPFARTGVTKVGDYEAYEYEVDGGKIVEGVGYVSAGYGDLLDFGLIYRIGPVIQGFWGLCLLEDNSGRILYKGPFYNDYIAELKRIADISGDGRVDVSDLIAAIDAAVGKTENGKADVNCDGRVDIADVNTVVNVILNAR